MLIKHALATATMIISILPSAAAQTGQRNIERNDKRQVLKDLEHRWQVALARRDLKTLDQLMSDEYTLTTVRGELVDKAKVLEQMRSVNADAEVENTDVNVRLYKDSAVVTGRVIIKGRFDGKQMSTQSRYIKVYVKRDGRWQVVAAQATLMPQQ